MNKKKLTFLLILIFLTTSCGNSWDSVKRGLTGAKSKSADEFLVEKKDPLILPPDFDELPSPSEKEEIKERMLSLEKQLAESSFEDSTESSSSEMSILEKIRKQ